VRLTRLGQPGAERPGLLLDDDRRKDCSHLFTDWDTAFFRSGGMAALRDMDAGTMENLPDADPGERWAAPVARPGKVVCIGLNYLDHARETNCEPPSEPVVFLKAANAVIGPYDDVLIPRGCEKTDWEIELAVVIGRDARYLETPDDAVAHIAGYTIGNDVSERAWQWERGGQWTKGKSADTFCPLGPWLATPDVTGPPEGLELRLTVNGVLKQQGSPRTMVFSVPHLVWYLSQCMTLEAGDVVLTGTPPGVGMGRKPPEFLREGDVMELAITGLGSQRCRCARA
jgi:2,4-didehydro-3-deoxy-L-rhamnonate hydrolase